MSEPTETTSETKQKKLSLIAGNKCCLPHCDRSKRNFPNLKIFRFPYCNDILLKAWIEKCNFDESFLERSQTLYTYM